MNRRLIIVFPGFPPCFEEFEAAYKKATSKMDRVSIDRLDRWTPDRPEWKDPSVAVIFWCQLPTQIPSDRAARCAFYHLESSASPETLTRGQGEMVEKFIQRAKELDLFLVTTPAAEEFWASKAKKVSVVPIGYDAETMGAPDWFQPKTHDIGYCGTLVGRREWIVPVIQKRFGNRFKLIQEIGKKMQEEFNSCRVMLHVAHSEEPGFPTLRLWQAISTSAVLVTERRDAWPGVAGRHFLAVPPAQRENPESFADSIEELLRRPLVCIAYQAHHDLAAYTVNRCIEEFMIPAVEALK